MHNNDTEFDSWMVERLRAAPVSSPAHEQAAIELALRLHHRPRWAKPARWATALAVTAVGGLVLFHPAPSVAAPRLEQVDAAVRAANHYRITYQLDQGGFPVLKTVDNRDGERWREDYYIGDKVAIAIAMNGRATYSICYLSNRKFAFRDGPMKASKKPTMIPNGRNFASAPSELFRTATGPVTATPGVSWHGRAVDRFECMSPGISRASHGPPLRFRHVLYVDPATHLPIQLDVGVADPHGIQETFTYDFGPTASDTFEPKPPTKTKVVDLLAERRAVHDALSRDGLVVFDSDHTFGVFLPDRPDVARATIRHKVKVSVQGQRMSEIWPEFVTVDAQGAWANVRPWKQTFLFQNSWLPGLADFHEGEAVKVQILGKTYRMRVKKVASVRAEFLLAGRQYQALPMPATDTINEARDSIGK